MCPVILAKGVLFWLMTNTLFDYKKGHLLCTHCESIACNSMVLKLIAATKSCRIHLELILFTFVLSTSDF